MATKLKNLKKERFTEFKEMSQSMKQKAMDGGARAIGKKMLKCYVKFLIIYWHFQILRKML